jgi:Fe-S cluster biosynthesis and repair protein YggX|tara:strand:+ start:27445 stop:29634 length:2190 start_codon:yes stop_codon:yes gene_type:complete
MISKKVPMRTPRKSSFGNLTKYLIDEQGKLERLGDILISNCHSTDPVWAALEVEATQEMNTRALSDKTYHLIVSFREGENPSADVLKDVEQQMANALGFAEHQRIAVVHRDTDNVHMHIAINKIHPVTNTLHEPYRDHRTRDEVCAMLEEKHGLARDNHKARKTPGQARAADMENMAGLESLLSYSKAIADDLKAADTWEQLHTTLQKNGLEIRPQGAGLVIAAGDVVIKASSVDRALSKNALESRLGAFQGPEGKTVEPERQYVKKPVIEAQAVPSLYAKYTEERHTYAIARKNAWQRVKNEQTAKIDLLKKTAALKRAALKFAPPGLVKRLAHRQISKDLMDGIKAAQQEQTKKRAQIYQTYTRPVWQDWLKKQALAGNEAAASLLRNRKDKERQKYEANGFDSQTDPVKPGNIPGAPINNVTSKGAVVYKLADTPIRDDGRTLKVSRWPTSNGLLASLHMAMHRFGNKLTITGNAEFKTAVARTAAANKLNVTFDDPALEKLRQTYITNPNAKDKYHDRSQQRGRDFSRNAGSPGQAGRTGAAKQSASGTTSQRNDRSEPGLYQPNIKRLGTNPPPTAQNRLRPMSECGLVLNQRGSEVLLPSNVSSVVGQQEAQRDNSVRRNVSGPGLDNKVAAVNKYVNERNETRKKVFDISHHRGYTQFDTGIAIYSGIRHVDGQALALLAKDNQMLVMPVDAKTAGRLSRLKVGTTVTIAKGGNVTVKGRSR